MKNRDKDAKRALSAAELQAELRATREKLFKLRFRHRVTRLDDPLELRRMRRHAARLQTWIREKSGQEVRP